ncbi:hypothetical protein AArcSl_2884 [Halalkaliarchaeum desulfuricum]|uniref:Small CPxCG-related zinc finger protein n=1 Tax=Halalkaliarchaeum desulfuricum TaxID=2055893 RepID=A0A343TN23_9EURY|nr:hypothetical protein [Halalkaliarchaeum desulfuricum]AUX10495.1 hypothetical protein AArcSl_2884 [Halalkaliarchaeum desulfuricum]
MSDGEEDDPCHACGESTTDALSRTVRLSVDRSTIDTQRLCPECFAEWIARYEEEMKNERAAGIDDDPDSEIIVD